MLPPSSTAGSPIRGSGSNPSHQHHSLTLPSSSSSSSSLPSRLSRSRIEPTRTPTPSFSTPRRSNAHFTSSLFQQPFTAARMTSNFDSLNVDSAFAPCQAGEIFTHEWPIHEIEKLRRYVEDYTPNGWTVDADFDEAEFMPQVLSRGVILGGGWFKLDLVRATRQSPTPSSEDDPTDAASAGSSPIVEKNRLSLYVAALSIDTSSHEVVYAANIFVGIKAVRQNTGKRYGETQWIWHTETEFDFTPHSEFWETQLPVLSDLLAVPEVSHEDAFTLCVHISTPPPHLPKFTLPGQITVPKSIVDGLRGLVDSTTGDVKFVCLEHAVTPTVKTAHVGENGEDDEEAIEGEENDKLNLLSRKRVLYAHSEILKSASDYFNDLLTGGFQEAERAKRADTRHFTIVVDDAGLEAVYWTLHFVYTNELYFAPRENVRGLMKQLHIDRQEIHRYLTATTSHCLGVGEWEYRRIPMEGEDSDDLDNFDTRTTHSVSSASTRLSAISPPPSLSPSRAKDRTGSSTSATNSAAGKVTSTSARLTPSKAATRVPLTATPNRPKPPLPKPTSASSSKSTSTSMSGATNTNTVVSQVSPNIKPQSRGYIPPHHSTPDPYAHPCAPPAAASALSVYMLSHRYRLEALENLAKDHILANMSSENCMPMLLATYQYETLHQDTLDFIIDHWGAVQLGGQFLKCIQEVSAGIWGEAGGLVLHGLFRRLSGPSFG